MIQTIKISPPAPSTQRRRVPLPREILRQQGRRRAGLSQNGIRLHGTTPEWLMHNWIGATPTHHFPDYVAKRLITVSDAEDYRMGQFDAEDVSKFAAAAFLEPERFSGEEIGLECGALTFAEIAQYLSTATGVEVTVKHRTQEETEAVKGPVLMEVQRYGSSARFLGDQAKLTG
ncbi:hypothetical protein C8J57DRAFT_1371413 [Mycena rebaudengoi]|nr:hypothetical protein C8J57DRAFT_1371413 [Mycena rebaudengoi]